MKESSLKKIQASKEKCQNQSENDSTSRWKFAEHSLKNRRQTEDRKGTRPQRWYCDKRYWKRTVLYKMYSITFKAAVYLKYLIIKYIFIDIYLCIITCVVNKLLFHIGHNWIWRQHFESWCIVLISLVKKYHYNCFCILCHYLVWTI